MVKKNSKFKNEFVYVRVSRKRREDLNIEYTKETILPKDFEVVITSCQKAGEAAWRLGGYCRRLSVVWLQRPSASLGVLL